MLPAAVEKKALGVQLSGLSNLGSRHQKVESLKPDEGEFAFPAIE